MKKHTITITVTAPTSFSSQEVFDSVQRLVWIGKEDAEQTIRNNEGDLEAALLATSLRLKFKLNKE